MARLLPILALVAFPVHTAPHHPAHYRDWLKIARCESDSEWHIKSPPYFGGLQFLTSSWRSEHGTQFAVRADLASKRHQMQIANRLLKAQGWGAWPVCSVVAGVG